MPPRNQEQKLRTVLREDFRRGEFWSTLKKDFRDLKEFYVSEDQQARLRRMGVLRRWFLTAWWILKSMLLNLSPVRRLLIFFGVILIYFGPQVTIEDENISTSDWHALGGTMLIIVLMLELKDKLLARDELEAGRKIQMALMPEASPVIPGWSVWLHSQPANEVGGDLVDYLALPSGRHTIALGDVAGKGLKAALLMAKIQATVRAIAPDMKSLSLLAAKINQIFHRDSVPGVFASLMVIQVGGAPGRVSYVNAGHLPPFLISGKAVREKPKGKTALGLVAGMKYRETVVNLKKGDVFFAYSDGLVEARNEQGEFFGSDRLQSLLPGLAHLSAPAFGEALLNEVRSFQGDARVADDLSVVVLKRV